VWEGGRVGVGVSRNLVLKKHHDGPEKGEKGLSLWKSSEKWGGGGGGGGGGLRLRGGG